MHHFVFAAPRNQDQFTSLQCHGFRVRLAQEGTPFRHEMEHHRMATLPHCYVIARYAY